MPRVNIYVETAGTHWTGVKECIQAVKHPETYATHFDLGMLIGMFEEEALVQLDQELQERHYNGYLSDFEEMFRDIADEIRANIKVYVGHIDICTDYLSRIEAELPSYNSYPNPTIVLLVGCLGTSFAQEANEKEVFQNSKCVVMGFEDLVHIYDNTIYACKLRHVSLPDMRCAYDGAEEDYKKLLGDSSNDYDLEMATYQSLNPLVQCCESKLNRFRSRFLENLRRRDCVHYTRENLIQKMRALLNEDGSINRDMLFSPEGYIFSSGDGTPCTTPENCVIRDPYESSIKKAEEFNQRSTIFNLFETFKRFAEEKQFDKDKDDFLLKQLQNLRPEEKSVVKYDQNGLTLLHIFAFYGYTKCLDYLLKKFDDLPIEYIDDETGNYFFEDLISNEHNSEEEKLYFIIKLNEKYPDLFVNTSTPTRKDVLYLSVVFQYTSIVRYLGDQTNFDFMNKKGGLEKGDMGNLLFVAGKVYPLTGDHNYKLIKILFAKGLDPNELTEKRYDFLEYYFNTNLPIINPKILREFCNYRYDNIKSVDRWIEKWNSMLKNPVDQIKFKDEILKYYESLTIDRIKGQEISRVHDELSDTVDSVVANLGVVLKNTIKLLEECKKIILKGGKTNKQLNVNHNKTVKQIQNNLQRVTRKVLAPEKIPGKYKEIDEYIKKVGAKFTKEEKRVYREKGVALLQNKNTNALERLQKLENLLTEIEEEAKKRTSGGKRFNRTRKLRS